MSKLGIALGGGGARGLAHIGVLRVLEKRKIKIHAITGCSMGAIIGGLYAYYGNINDVEKFIYNVLNNPRFKELGISKLGDSKNALNRNFMEQLFDFIEVRLKAFKSLTSLSYFEEEETEELFQIIPDVPIESMKIKFSAVATDLISGEEINFTSGSLRTAIRASSAIPGIFPPVKYKNYLLVDGYTSETVPATKLKILGADRILAVDVMRKLKHSKAPENIIDLLYRTEDITAYHLALLKLKEADLIIHPDIKNLSWADFEHADEIIKAGELAAIENLYEIKKLVNRFPVTLWFFKLMRYLRRV
ncbi:patatin-like phospholipase family protein [Melioribacter sp. OK-6-Me]|uniref:patatin-like phospholipase family protein n=1 Tax=unclassified Melioribacter TaxID=2627329 RepID=UPI003EDB1A4D